MTILLTGSTGFIGSALIRSPHLQGRLLAAAVRRTTNTLPSSIQQKSIGNLLPNTNWIPALNNIDTVIHLAGRAHIIKEQLIEPLSSFSETNSQATLNLARQSSSVGVRRFIFISSIGVNGNQTFDKPFTAADIPNPAEPYATSKHEAEIGLHQIAAETGMDVVTIRPPLVYGANAPGNFGRLIHTVARGTPLPLGAIHNQRSLVALDNLVDLITTCIDHPAAANQTFLVSDGEDLSTTELLQRLSKALGKPSRLLPVPQTLLETSLKLIGKGDIAQRICGNLQIDITQTKQLLDWEPPVSVDEALQQTAEAYLQSLH